MRKDGVGQLAADVDHGIEVVHGALQHHARLVPAKQPQFLRAELQNILPAEEDLAATNRRGALQQAHDRESRRRFAAAALSGQPEELAWMDVKADVRHGLHVAALGLVFDA